MRFRFTFLGFIPPTSVPCYFHSLLPHFPLLQFVCPMTRLVSPHLARASGFDTWPSRHRHQEALHANLTLPGSLIRSATACCAARVDTSANPGSLCTRSSRCPGMNDSSCRCSTRSPAPDPPHPRTHYASPTLAVGYNVCVVSTGYSEKRCSCNSCECGHQAAS